MRRHAFGEHERVGRGVGDAGEVVEAAERYEQHERQRDQPADRERQREAQARPGQDRLGASPAIGHGAAHDRAGNVGDIGQRRKEQGDRRRVFMAVCDERGSEECGQPGPHAEELPVVKAVPPDREHAAAVAPHGR